MNEIIIRHVLPQDLDECYTVEASGFPPEEAATRETIQLRMNTFPEGFLVAVREGRIVGILNSAATNKDDIPDEELTPEDLREIEDAMSQIKVVGNRY